MIRVPLVPWGKSKGWQLALNYFSFAFSASLLAPFYCRRKFYVIFVFESYLTCGKPIIAALDGEGGRLVEESGAGLASPAGDAEAMAKAVLAMYHMPKAKRENMGRRGRDYYKSNFERDMLIDRLEGWMQELSKKENITKCLKTKRCL